MKSRESRSELRALREFEEKGLFKGVEEAGEMPDEEFYDAELSSIVEEHLGGFPVFAVLPEKAQQFLAGLYRSAADFVNAEHEFETPEAVTLDERLSALAEHRKELAEAHSSLGHDAVLQPLEDYFSLGVATGYLAGMKGMMRLPQNPHSSAKAIWPHAPRYMPWSETLAGMVARPTGEDPIALRYHERQKVQEALDVLQPLTRSEEAFLAANVPIDKFRPARKAAAEVYSDVLGRAEAMQTKLRRALGEEVRKYLDDLREQSIGALGPEALQYSPESFERVRRFLASLESEPDFSPISLLREKVLAQFNLAPYELLAKRLGFSSRIRLSADTHGMDFLAVRRNVGFDDINDDLEALLNAPHYERLLLRELQKVQDLPFTVVPWLAQLAIRNKRIRNVLVDDEMLFPTTSAAPAYFYVATRPESERRSLLQNLNTNALEELVKHGINLEIFLEGIKPVFFDLQGFMAGRDVLTGRAVAELKAASGNVTASLVASRDALMRKVYSAVNMQPAKGESLESELGNVLAAIEKNEKLLVKYADAVADYLSKSANVNDMVQAQAHRVHFIAAKKLLVGRGSDTGQGLFELRHSKKDLVQDISLGYDSGCCLVEQNIIPHLFDVSTQFTELRRGGNRVGMAMLFACVDQLNKPVLAINSIEMSDAMRGYSDESLGSLVDSMLRRITAYAGEAGFTRVLLGSHSYNTAYNYGSFVKDRPSQGDYRVRKIGPWVYADILGSSGALSGGHPRIAEVQNCIALN